MSRLPFGVCMYWPNSRMVCVMRTRTTLLIFILAAVLYSGCGTCGEEVLTEVTSPGHTYVAAVFRRGCGATSGFLYHVNIRSVAASFSFDAQGALEDGQVFLTREGKIRISWHDDRTLRITCEGCPKDRPPALERWNGISISYEFRDRGAQRRPGGS